MRSTCPVALGGRDERDQEEGEAGDARGVGDQRMTLVISSEYAVSLPLASTPVTENQ